MSNPFQPDPDAQPGELASLLSRFLAALIDGLLIAIPVSILTFPLWWIAIVPQLVISIIGFALAFAIFAAINFKLLAKSGQTIGKRVMNLKIVKGDGELMDAQQLLIKRYGVFWLLGAIPYIGPILALINVLLVFRQSRKAGHDEVAGTQVVNA